MKMGVAKTQAKRLLAVLVLCGATAAMPYISFCQDHANDEGKREQMSLILERAKGYAAAGDIVLAEATLKTANNMVQGFWKEPRVLLAEIYLDQGRNEEALQILTEYYRPYRYLDQDALVCIAAARVGDSENAERASWNRLSVPAGVAKEFGGLENLPRIDQKLNHSELMRAYEAIGHIFLATVKDRPIAKSIADLKRAEALFPENAAIQYWLGVQNLTKGDKDAARQHFMRASSRANGKLSKMVQQKLVELSRS